MAEAGDGRDLLRQKHQSSLLRGCSTLIHKGKV